MQHGMLLTTKQLALMNPNKKLDADFTSAVAALKPLQMRVEKVLI